jgi:DNA-binding MarR family transcriptional regulator
MSPGFWPHHAALAWRQVFGRPPTQQEVADHAGTDRMMTFKLLQTLMDRGLVIRQPDPADGRVKRLVLTPAG